MHPIEKREVNVGRERVNSCMGCGRIACVATATTLFVQMQIRVFAIDVLDLSGAMVGLVRGQA